MEFAGVVEVDAVLGEDWIPLIPVRLRHGRRVRPSQVLVDPGAHISLIPLSIGGELGLTSDPDDALSQGNAIGGWNVPFRLRRLTIEIGQFAVLARVGWLTDDETPPLLGRLDVFDAFHFEFRQSERTLVVTPTRM